MRAVRSGISTRVGKKYAWPRRLIQNRCHAHARVPHQNQMRRRHRGRRLGCALTLSSSLTLAQCKQAAHNGCEEHTPALVTGYPSQENPSKGFVSVEIFCSGRWKQLGMAKNSDALLLTTSSTYDIRPQPTASLQTPRRRAAPSDSEHDLRDVLASTTQQNFTVINAGMIV